jgi:hypothetical protein
MKSYPEWLQHSAVELESWEDAAAQAGDAATMLIAGIARGCPARGLLGMTAEDVEREWPTVTDSSSGDEIVALLRSPAQALAIAESWGSPYPID